MCALVVDDNLDAARTLAQVLAVMGSDATFLTDPRQAVQEALRLRPHIAFLDIGMPPHVKKPADPDLVLSIIRTVVPGRR